MGIALTSAADDDRLRLRKAIETTQLGVTITDTEGRVVYSNPADAAMHGYSAEEMIGLPARMLAPASQSQGLDLKSVSTWSRESINKRKDGTLFPVRLTSDVVFDSKGRRLGVVTTCQDITEEMKIRQELQEAREVLEQRVAERTAELAAANASLHAEVAERVRAEETIRDSERKYRQLFEGANDAILIFEPDTERVLEANRKACEVYGYAHDELIGMTVKTISRDVARGEEQIRKLLETGSYLNFESVQYRKDGTPLHLLISSSVVDYEGSTAILSINRDISGLKRLEDQLRQSQKMEAVGRLAGGVAHDFNNLLQAVLSQLQVLRERERTVGPTGKALEEVEQQVRRGAALTRQLLLFSRRETARVEHLDLNQVVRGAVSLLRPLVRENIDISIDLGPGPLPVNADHGQLDQVLMNLVVNASDAMASGGRLNIRTGGQPDHRVWFSVEDSGHGVPDSIRDRIFEPFFTTKPRAEGTGLGLSVVHGIVARHGGIVEVESRVGQGTAFTVTLPRAETTPAAQPVPPPQSTARAAPRPGRRLLLVEDEPGVRQGLETALVMLGYYVIAVASGEEALGLGLDEPFDLLLTDLLLPGMTGVQLAWEVRGLWPSCKVIMMSGYAEDEVVRRELSSGELRFLQKPFDLDTLAGEIESVLTK